MRTVNLLPAWYLQQQRRQKNIRLHIGAMILIGVAMFGTTILGQRRLAVMTQERELLASSMRQVGDPDTELRRLETELRRLEDLRSARQELGNTIPMSEVIQQLQNDMTPGVALSNVSINVRPEPVKGSGFVGDPKNPPRYHDVAHLTVVGISPNDQQITQLVEKVSKNALFSDVSLNYTRTGTLQGYTVRRFEFQLSMDLERLSMVDPDPAAAASAKPIASGGTVHGE